ncbi:hypothetical protein FHS85_004800 [Rhodoligotrophos appendicifer]|uniref:hypothetical protein n=1 Tax=Rhodoligotrophos appendicifer TaxID=987056 RepID=UPI001186D8E6|nr:hypothetical protein [Rhodoligotrophos appendicifer]
MSGEPVSWAEACIWSDIVRQFFNAYGRDPNEHEHRGILELCRAGAAGKAATVTMTNVRPLRPLGAGRPNFLKAVAP